MRKLNIFSALMLLIAAHFHRDSIPINEIKFQYINIYGQEHVYLLNISDFDNLENYLILPYSYSFLKLNLNLTNHQYLDRILELERESNLYISSREFYITNLVSQSRLDDCFKSKSHINNLDIVKLLNKYNKKDYHDFLNINIVFEFINIDHQNYLSLHRISFENNMCYYVQVDGLFNHKFKF